MCRKKEREREEEENKHAIYSGHLSSCQQPRAAHALHSDQQCRFFTVGQMQIKSLCHNPNQCNQISVVMQSSGETECMLWEIQKGQLLPDGQGVVRFRVRHGQTFRESININQYFYHSSNPNYSNSFNNPLSQVPFSDPGYGLTKSLSLTNLQNQQNQQKNMSYVGGSAINIYHVCLHRAIWQKSTECL